MPRIRELKRSSHKLDHLRYVLRLYVTGTTTKSQAAIMNIKKICENELKGRCDLKVIDIYQQPALAKGEQIVATPTLIKKLPLPLRTIVGDMSNKERVLFGLDFRARKTDGKEDGERSLGKR